MQVYVHVSLYNQSRNLMSLTLYLTDLNAKKKYEKYEKISDNVN